VENRRTALSESRLESFIIPASAVVIGNAAFRKCRSIASVTFEAVPMLQEIRGMPAKSGLKGIVVPSSVGVTGERAFGKCKSLASVAFQASSVLR
jgi:hypothetical protein